jgi:hypothetical protein
METSTQDLNAPSSDTANPNPHVLWRQITGFVLWVGLLSFAAGGPIGSLFCLALGGVTFADAWVSGIYKRPGTKSFLNISPMAWGIVMALLFIVAYPTYLLNRNKLRTVNAGNGYFIATIVFGAVVIVLLVLNVVIATSALH